MIRNVAVLGSRDPSDLTFVSCTALLDTGATSSGLGPQIISRLGLKSHEKKRLSVATEMRMVDYFLFRIGFNPTSTEGSSPVLPFIFPETDGFSWLEAKSFDLILGMDVLRQCDFQLNRNGSWQLNFG